MTIIFSNLRRLSLLLPLALLLGGCVSSGSVPLGDGDTFEAHAVEVGAQSLAVWRVTDVQTGATQTNVVASDSMAARILPGVATAVTGGLVNGVVAHSLQRDACDDCGGPGVSINVAGGTAVANSQSSSQNNSAVVVGPCGRPNCPTLGH